jgi:hypothetical protein
MWATYPRSASSDYYAEFHEGCSQKHTNPLNCRTSGSDISGYHTDLHEEHRTIAEWHSRHGMCELAFMAPLRHLPQRPAGLLARIRKVSPHSEN